VRQAVLPDLSSKISTTQAVSFHSFIINICRSIGPAIAGGLIAVYHTPTTFLAQAVCYFIAAVLCIPIHFEVILSQKEGKALPLKVVLNYFKSNLEGSQIFITSIIIMATGFSYTTVLPVLTNPIFPGQSQVFGIAMTFCSCNNSLTINFKTLEYSKNVLSQFNIIWYSFTRYYHTSFSSYVYLYYVNRLV